MHRNFILVFLMGILCGCALSAGAQNQVYAFDFHSITYGYDVTGELVSVPNGDGTYTAVSGNITVPSSVSPMAGFQPGTYGLLSPGFYGGNDNILFPGQNPVVDVNGLSFGNAAVTYEFNLYSTGVYILLDSNGALDYGTMTLNPLAPVQSISSGLVYNFATHLYYGTITLKNIGQTATSGSLVTVLNNLTPGVVLKNATGNSNGSYYIVSNISMLAPGASLVVPVQFSDPSNARIGYSPFTYVVTP